MNVNIGFIGAGNMGQAMITGMIKSETVSPDKIFVSSIATDELNHFADRAGFNLLKSNRDVIKECDIIILAVKPDKAFDVLSDCADEFDGGKIFVTVAAGLPIAFYERILGCDKKIVRTMPNTPAMVLESMTAICCNKNVSDDERSVVGRLFEAFGVVEFIDEEKMSAVTAVAGSSPAYAFMFIEAMADGAVKMGLPRQTAYKMAAQALKGSAQMVLETGENPAKLKDMVCSPGGTTIEAVATLEKCGFRSAVIEAVCDCAAKADKMKER